MRRAERLFRLVQHLRAAGRPCTADRIGVALEVSRRTIYRDIAHLQASGLPIDGEAGVGYILRPGFDLPPMTFTREQIEALALGARLVGAVGDAEIARAAREVLAKLSAVLPGDAGRALNETPLFAFARGGTDQNALPELRRAIRTKARIELEYVSIGGENTRRIVRPLALVCFGPVWLLTAWCELRRGFRHFRTDRIDGLDVLQGRFTDEPGQGYADYLATEDDGTARFKAGSSATVDMPQRSALPARA